MAQGIEAAVDTYIRAWRERDPALRAQLLEACFAKDGRFVTRSRVLEGRAALLEMMARVHADPNLRELRLTSAIDAQGISFRFRAVGDLVDGGTTPETLDVGELDADGRIAQVLSFTGPLAPPNT